MDLVADRCGGSCGELEIWDRHVVDLVADRCGGSCGERTKAPHRARLPSLKSVFGIGLEVGKIIPFLI